MQLYCLVHNFSQLCTGCGGACLKFYVRAKDPQHAVTSKKAKCRSCTRIDPLERWDAEDINIIHPWVGVDLDGTLAYSQPPERIMEVGEPIPVMVERVRKMIEDGVNVKIFTARVAATGAYSSRSQRFDDLKFAHDQRRAIEAWCAQHLGYVLPITATKDFACMGIIDDIAKQVRRDTGELIEEQASLYRQL